ncbi:MAG: RpiB/LacA/LacB family sugar-phosphate isomerase [Bacilli bacterium]
MKILIGADHRGNEIKEKLSNELNKEGYEVILSSLPNSTDDDYVDFAIDICMKMQKDDIGILICGNGIGMSIIANKVKGIRCARVVSEDDAKKAKEHNGANALALGADLGFDKIISIVNAFLETPSISEKRHLRRIEKIINYENGAYNEL